MTGGEVGSPTLSSDEIREAPVSGRVTVLVGEFDGHASVELIF